MSVKVIGFFFLMIMGCSVNIIEAGRSQKQLDPKMITTTPMFNNDATNHYPLSQDEFLCKCLDMGRSCQPSCERCDCLEPDNGVGVNNNLCMCDDLRKYSCPQSCQTCFCSPDL
ncbi:hypothetical protein AAHE18_19G145600 [Arachis hypogaea]|uniref:Bowman-Birk serine protease inhibitors family domain-containing protein n=1 Tax=Arachis hypogaea TaxID=3818 RepID=A0A6B9V9A1_ARAHY|nr:uncharacterized protein LOC112778571 [Arachis hypogaea]QHN77953.1 uncharacterized protein DS421_19g657300 [Arachis hypogaea]